MELVGRGPLRVCYLGADEQVADWVRAAFERADHDTEFVAETGVETALDRIASAQERIDPRMRTPLVETEDPFDCLVCTDEADDRDPITFIESVREDYDHLPVVLFADDGSESMASRAIRAGVDGYVTTVEDDPTGTLVDRVVSLGQAHREEKRERLAGEQARRIVDENQEMIMVVNPGAMVGYHNEATERHLGIDPTEGEDMVPFGRIHPDDLQSIREEFYNAVRNPEYEPVVEFSIRDEDGDWRTVESRGRNLLSDPLVHGFVVTSRDITERKERERDLEGYKTIVENTGDPIYVLDREGHFDWVNEAFLEQTGYDREVVEDSHVSRFMREEDIEKGAELISNLMADEDLNWDSFEFVAENVHGEFRRFEDKIAVLTDDEGNLRGSVGVIRDVTDES
jgi:PAS domain S-box-containing protein